MKFTYFFLVDVRKCAVCEAAVDIMDKVLENPNVDHTLEHVLEKTCRALPASYEPMVSINK